MTFNWSGDNSASARKVAAQELMTKISKNLKPGEPLNVVAHSHGGNVVKEYTQLPGAKKIDTAVNLATPQRDDHKMNMKNVGAYINAYSNNDSIQNNGGPFYDSPLWGEYGFAGRTDSQATNVEASTAKFPRPRGNPRTVTRNIGHSEMHSPSVWQQYLDPAIQANP